MENCYRNTLDLSWDLSWGIYLENCHRNTLDLSWGNISGELLP